MRCRHVYVLAAALALAACHKYGPPPDVFTTPTDGPFGTPPASPSTPVASPVTEPPASEGRVAVYYLHDGDAARLYREFRLVRRGSAVIRAAVDTMLHVAPLDPDYRSVWPAATTVNGISISGTVATVDLSAAARSATASETVERQSLQQLVYTVTGAAPSISGVRLVFDGAARPTLWGHVATTGPFTRAPAADVLGAVWVLSPAQHATVGHTLVASGVATVFEGTVSWRLSRLDGRVVAHGATQASAGGPARGTWSVTVRVPATVTGDVVFTAFESSAEDGSEQSPDDKRYSVG